MRISVPVVAALTAFTMLTPLFGDKLEYAGGQIVVGGTTAPMNQAALYAPSFTYSLNGSEVFLYVQGVQNMFNGTLDSIYLYRNPNTWTGLTSPYTLDKAILPNPMEGHDNTFYYGGPSVCTAGGKYFLSAGKSPDAVTFYELLWGRSTDGANFSWNTLLKWMNPDGTPRGGAYKLTAATVAAVNIGGTDYFWGFIEMWKPLAGVGVGGIRMRRSAADPRGYDLIELRSGNQWTAVANDGTFTFEPDFLWIGINMAKLVWSGTDWYLWGSGGGTPEHCGSCDHLYSAQGNWSDRFVYRKVRTDYSMDPIETVDSGIRCMPGGYPSSRTFPMPAPGGLLYSSTNEGNCGLYTDPNYGNHIVVTAIQ